METISTLSVSLEKLSSYILKECTNMCKNLDGNLKDIGNGTHIKIPTDVGYVNFYRSPNSYEITAWTKLTIQDNLTIKEEHQLHLNKTKSDEL